MPNVYLAMPNSGTDDMKAKGTLLNAYGGGLNIFPRSSMGSLLTTNFNERWTEALNMRKANDLTHFAMFHSDIGAEHLWLSKLLKEQERVGADLISAVVPMKDPAYPLGDGPVTTGYFHEDKFHRLTLKELAGAPETFDAAGLAEHIGKPVDVLCVNTGLWVCDFTKPWTTGEVDGLQLRFHQRDRIGQLPDGSFKTFNFPEDWNFSLDCARLGAKVFATFCVKVKHCGRYEWSNER